MEIDWEYFFERVEDALWKLNYPAPHTSVPLGEITFEDLSKHQFWQDGQDLFKKEE